MASTTCATSRHFFDWIAARPARAGKIIETTIAYDHTVRLRLDRSAGRIVVFPDAQTFIHFAKPHFDDLTKLCGLTLSSSLIARVTEETSQEASSEAYTPLDEDWFRTHDPRVLATIPELIQPDVPLYYYDPGTRRMVETIVMLAVDGDGSKVVVPDLVTRSIVRLVTDHIGSILAHHIPDRVLVRAIMSLGKEPEFVDMIREIVLPLIEQ